MIELADVLVNRAWLRRERPFPHVVAQNVFREDFYEQLADQLRQILVRGLSETPSPYLFSRSIPGYDSYGIGFDHSIIGPASLFISPAWRDLMSGLFGIGVTPFVFAGSHYHSVGSKNGFVHSDFNPVWFRRQNNGSIQVPSSDVCSYTRGAGPLGESEKVQVVRGAVVLFFLLNDGWRPGDGGEIGLFSSSGSDVHQPTLSCAPLNNSLVAFECTPDSLHGFLSNSRLPRTSIIMWVHRTLEEARERFGEGRLERWKE
jgi:hypothetical protein